MKTNRKIMLVVVLSGMILFALSFTPADEKTESIMIKSFQTLVMGKSYLQVYKGGGQFEKTDLGKWKLEDEEKNYDKIFTTVRNYEMQGYEVVSHSETMFGDNVVVNTFILTKK